jgi:hypothetical protein
LDSKFEEEKENEMLPLHRIIAKSKIQKLEYEDSTDLNPQLSIINAL